VDPFTDEELIIATVKGRAVDRVAVEAIGRFDLTPRDWEMVEMVDPGLAQTNYLRCQGKPMRTAPGNALRGDQPTHREVDH
jgi:hypothetical protein